MWYKLLATFALSTSLLMGNSSYSSLDFQGVPLDQKLVKILGDDRGTFIEVGANDGIAQSNTKLLEEVYGWTGILIEPSEVLFKRLCVNRPHSWCVQCALGSFDEHGRIAYGDFDGHLMSSLKGERLRREAQQKVLVRSLQSILDEVGLAHINFFSLDTEGHELNILQGIDFAKTTFDYLLIEVYTEQYEEITEFLSQNGYELIENFSNYNSTTNPFWDGTHNDYLFQKRNRIK